MACAPVRRLVDPLDLEAKRRELGCQHIGHRLHARMVVRARIDQRDLLEQRDIPLEPALDGFDHDLFRIAELRGGGGGKQRRETRDEAERPRPHQ